jgi:FlaA1/EpsC-like NDP-sugar epimerase
MGGGGEIFIFDMGDPVKIIDLATKMIKLSGLEPHKDIKIKITGLRPGEKLYEELLNDRSTTHPTYNDKIMIATEKHFTYDWVANQMAELQKIVLNGSDFTLMVHKMKEIVPEFISQNSVYQTLDVQNSDHD